MTSGASFAGGCRSGLALGVVVLGLALVGANPAWSQGEIFADGFESGDTSAWSETWFGGLLLELPGGVEMAFKQVRAGSFMMGSPVTERGRYDQEDLHQVTLTQSYFLGSTEVTQAQWEAVTGAPMSTSCGPYGVDPTLPVYCVSWNEITEVGGFLDQLNAYLLSTGQPTGFRLPSEAEWERAARAGTQTRFSHGDVLECDDECEHCFPHMFYMWWCGDFPPWSCQPVGSRLANAFGLYDMHGNLFEWVQDWFYPYLGTSPVTDPTGPATGSGRVIRGGSWSGYARDCRSAFRSPVDPPYRSFDLGFRLARTAP